MDYMWLVGNAIGMLLKRWDKYNNKLIPAAIFAYGVIFHAIRSLTGAPPPTPVGMLEGTVMLAGFGSLGGIFAAALMDTAKAVALHTIAKNTFMQGFFKPLLKDKK